uniref:Sulfotransferase n=1 Tax=Gadus morhua TaxID=8049 RepID=A0A8C4ZUN5_GADMO
CLVPWLQTTATAKTPCVMLSGTTWMQEIVPLIISQGDPELVDTVPNWDRVPWLEETRACDLNLDQRPSPRVFITHFKYDMMSTVCVFSLLFKVIYVMRNPRDAFTSYSHFSRMVSFLIHICNDLFSSLIFVVFGSWFDHVKGWLSVGEQQHIMYISYEQMILVRRLQIQLKIPLCLSLVLYHTKKMNSHDAFNLSLYVEPLMFSIVGDWKNHLTVAEAEYFDEFYQKKMQHVKHTFDWD